MFRKRCRAGARWTDGRTTPNTTPRRVLSVGAFLRCSRWFGGPTGKVPELLCPPGFADWLRTRRFNPPLVFSRKATRPLCVVRLHFENEGFFFFPPPFQQLLCLAVIPYMTPSFSGFGQKLISYIFSPPGDTGELLLPQCV